MKNIILLLSFVLISPNVLSAPTDSDQKPAAECTLELGDYARFVPIITESEGNLLAMSAKLRSVTFASREPVFLGILKDVKEASEDFFQVEREAFSQGRDLPGYVRERAYNAKELSDALKEIDYIGEGEPPPMIAKVFEMLITLVRFSEQEARTLQAVKSMPELADSHVRNLQILSDNLRSIRIVEVGDDATDIAKLRRVWLFYAQMESATYNKMRGNYPPPALTADVARPAPVEPAPAAPPPEPPPPQTPPPAAAAAEPSPTADTPAAEPQVAASTEPVPASERPDVIIPPAPPKDPGKPDE